LLRIDKLQLFEKAMIKDYITVGICALGFVALFALTSFRTYYVWSDCLGENGFLTCAAMLGK